MLSSSDLFKYYLHQTSHGKATRQVLKASKVCARMFYCHCCEDNLLFIEFSTKCEETFHHCKGQNAWRKKTSWRRLEVVDLDVIRSPKDQVAVPKWVGSLDTKDEWLLLDGEWLNDRLINAGQVSKCTRSSGCLIGTGIEIHSCWRYIKICSSAS